MNRDCLIKWGILGAFLARFSTHAHAQGVVLFGNSNLLRPPAGPERRVSAGGIPLSGANFMAQLLYLNNFGQWVAHETSSPFVTSSNLAGYWGGANRTLVNAGGPTSPTVMLQVQVWDAGCGAIALTFDQARARFNYWSQSAIFSYTEEFDAPPNNIDDKWMKNFTGLSTLSMPRPYVCSALHIADEIRFFVQGYGAAQRVVIDTRTNLTTASWVSIYTNFGGFWFTNAITASDPQRFYRAVFR